MTENDPVVARIVGDAYEMLKEISREMRVAPSDSETLKNYSSMLTDLANNLRTAAYFAEFDE